MRHLSKKRQKKREETGRPRKLLSQTDEPKPPAPPSTAAPPPPVVLAAAGIAAALYKTGLPTGDHKKSRHAGGGASAQQALRGASSGPQILAVAAQGSPASAAAAEPPVADAYCERRLPQGRGSESPGRIPRAKGLETGDDESEGPNVSGRKRPAYVALQGPGALPGPLGPPLFYGNRLSYPRSCRETRRHKLYLLCLPYCQ